MFYNTLKVKDLVKTGEKKMDRLTLLQRDHSCLTVIALQKDEIIDTHTSVEDAAVYVIDGKIEIHFDAEKFTVDEGEILMFKKDKEHKVVALKNSEFFVIRI